MPIDRLLPSFVFDCLFLISTDDPNALNIAGDVTLYAVGLNTNTGAKAEIYSQQLRLLTYSTVFLTDVVTIIDSPKVFLNTATNSRILFLTDSKAVLASLKYYKFISKIKLQAHEILVNITWHNSVTLDWVKDMRIT